MFNAVFGNYVPSTTQKETQPLQKYNDESSSLASSAENFQDSINLPLQSHQPTNQIQNPQQTYQNPNGFEIDFLEGPDHTAHEFRKITMEQNPQKEKKKKNSSLLLKILFLLLSFLFIIVFGVYMGIETQRKETNTLKLKIRIESILQNNFDGTKIQQQIKLQKQKESTPNSLIQVKNVGQAQKSSELKQKNIQEVKGVAENEQMKKQQSGQITYQNISENKTQKEGAKQIQIKKFQIQTKYLNQQVQPFPSELNGQLKDNLKKDQKLINGDKNSYNVNEKVKLIGSQETQITKLNISAQKDSVKQQKINLDKTKLNQEKLTQNQEQEKFLQTSKNLPQQLKTQLPLTCEEYIVKKLQIFGILYQFSNTHQQLRLLSNAAGLQRQFLTLLTRQQYSEAIDLLELVHHVLEDGQIQATDTPCETAESFKTRLNSVMRKQRQRLDQIYQIDFYHPKQLRFCIVTNSYRLAKFGLIYRNIDSILQQNYTNYHVVYTDDASPDGTGQNVIEYLKERKTTKGKFKVKINSEKKGMMENIFNAITYDCQLGEIVVMLDGDDSFIGTNVLSLLNAVYQKEKVVIVWNNFVQVLENRRVIIGFSRDIDQKNRNQLNFRDPQRFVSSHLKSFYVDVFREIKVEDLQYDDGKFYGGASDTAMMFCLIEMAYPYYRYVPEIVYEYRYDTDQVGMVTNRQDQLRAIAKIITTQPYKTLKNFTFIDHALQKVMVIKKE